MKNLKPIVLNKNSFEEAQNIYYEIINFVDYDIELIECVSEKFFFDPASAKYHNSQKHGLLFHSINVAIFTYKNMNFMRKNENMKYLNDLNDNEYLLYLKNSVFAALFHDYCKVGTYLPEQSLTEKQIYRIEQDCFKYNLEPNKYINKLGKASGSKFIDCLIKGNLEELDNIKAMYQWNDIFNIGHGEKSVIQLLRLGFKLTDHQIIAIRFHMMGLDDRLNIDGKKTFFIHMENIPMLKAIYLGDLITVTLYE